MSESYPSGSAGVVSSPPAGLSKDWFFLACMGIALMILGAVILGSSFLTAMTTFTMVVMFGIMLLVGAAFQIVMGIRGRRLGGFFLHLLAGVFYFVAGAFMLADPLVAAASLTLLIAALLFVGGICRIVLSLADRFEGWGWVLLNGVVSVVLGTAIWRAWPFSGLWVIGLFVGIEMVFGGLSWLMLALALRSNRMAPYGS